jgi:hypothetical protein
MRGHHRNSLSASSISSITSAYSVREDARRRPPPLVMAGGNPRMSGEIMYRPESPNSYQYRPHSPGGFSTPTSSTFSTGQNSPRWSSGIQSPASSHSRTHSLYTEHRTPGRRLSVPSAGNPFQSPHSGSYGQPPVGSINSSNVGTFPPTGMLASPPSSSSGSTWSRRESGASAADEAWRRRTWAHPEYYSSNFTSRLQNSVSVNQYPSGPPPQVPVVPSNAPPLNPNSTRLPGIESFDPIPRPTTPVRRQPSPMMIDTPTRVPMTPAESYRDERRGSQHWEMGMNRTMNRLDIAQSSPFETAGSWASDANRAVQAQAEQVRAQHPNQVRFEDSSYPPRSQPSAYQHQSAPPVTPRHAKRQGWYHGPVSVQHPPLDPQLQRTSPEDSSSSDGVPGTPSSATTIGDVNPSIMHSNGHVENRHDPHVYDPRIVPSNGTNGYTNYHPPPNGEPGYTYGHGQHAPPGQPQHQAPKGTDSNMLRLEALVAVATSEENVAAAAY